MIVIRCLSGAVAMVLWTAAPAVLAQEQWSPFRPLAAPVPPKTDDPAWSENAVDAFVYSRLHEEGLAPAPIVGRRVWLRRVTYDLTGLPPTPEQLAAFLTDPRPDRVAYEAVVDRLLASPRYGERWARHWLDVVRYADTDGFAIDAERPTLWRYRDYVIRAFNEDKPFDRFIREQIAGDEIDAGSEGIVATSFYRLGPWEADNMVPENRRQDFLNEMTSAIGSAMLGLTFGCARCHDHKYDPITQEDYYRLQAFLTPLKRSSVASPFISAELSPRLLEDKAGAEAELLLRRAALQAQALKLKAKLAAVAQTSLEKVTDEQLDKALKESSSPLSQSDRKQYQELKKRIDEDKQARRFSAFAVTVENPAADKPVPATHVLRNGDVFNPGRQVHPGFPSGVQPWSAEIFKQVDDVKQAAAGRRRLLAEWLASPHNPLTPRVLANRVWQHHMGQGLVSTSNDFGINGSGASHPELLDYLAGWFIRHGGRLKRLHRLLVLSRTYRTSSVHPAPERELQVDPENRLLWRANYRRLDAETIRDAVLAVSGGLNLAMGGPGFYEALPEGMKTSYSFFQWHASAEVQRGRRSIYMFQRRNLVHPMMEVFDGADMNASCERRKASVTAPQVLALFNSRFVEQAGRRLARRLRREAGTTPTGQVQHLFRLALARAAEADEVETCVQFLVDKKISYASKNTHDDHAEQPADAELAALADLCLVVLNTNEFLYLD